jgi:Protein of unknown function (DUF1524)
MKVRSGRRRHPRRTAALVAVLLALVVAGGAGASLWPLAPDRSVADAAPGTAAELLASLEVKERAPKTGYARDEFGSGWLDPDRNGCDTRNDTLARDLRDVVRSGPCTVVTGTLHDPYTGERVDFLRGQDTSALVQIDHVVPLSDAWQKGAQQLDPDRRRAFANDPLNVLAVWGPANAQKSDGDAATWLPKEKSVRCAYVARQVSVKAAYGLWVTPAERDAIARVLTRCPDEPAVTGAGAPLVVERG